MVRLGLACGLAHLARAAVLALAPRSPHSLFPQCAGAERPFHIAGTAIFFLNEGKGERLTSEDRAVIASALAQLKNEARTEFRRDPADLIAELAPLFAPAAAGGGAKPKAKAAKKEKVPKAAAPKRKSAVKKQAARAKGAKPGKMVAKKAAK